MRLSTDALRKTCWMHTETSIFELVIRDEDRDVWKVYLARQNWDQAKRSAKVSVLCWLGPQKHDDKSDILSGTLRLRGSATLSSPPRQTPTSLPAASSRRHRPMPNRQRASRRSFCASSTRMSETRFECSSSPSSNGSRNLCVWSDVIEAEWSYLRRPASPT